LHIVGQNARGLKPLELGANGGAGRLGSSFLRHEVRDVDELLAPDNSVGFATSQVVIAGECILQSEQACKLSKPIVLKNKFPLLITGQKGCECLEPGGGIDKGAK